VHYESPDERGIDNAFLYNKDVFKVQDSENIQVVFDGFDDKTRDILYVKGKLANGDVLHFLVNHWPSRREGKAASEPKRIQVAKIVKQKKDELLANNSNAKIIVLGDFNDEPEDKSVDICLDSEGDIADVDSHELYNTHYELSMQNKGSYKFRQHWNMLDQIMVSKALLSTEPGSLHYKLNSAAIKNEDWLQQHGNKYEGSPLRTYGGRNYLAGYSDHFSVHITLIIDNAK
jgi:endonuclease/exonuclease/phosphatase family metal-dependent hydrolase